MPKFRAKFRVESSEVNDQQQQVLLARAIYGTEGENADYAKATPWGELRINIDPSTDAHGMLEPGNDIYIDVIKIE